MSRRTHITLIILTLLAIFFVGMWEIYKRRPQSMSQRVCAEDIHYATLDGDIFTVTRERCKVLFQEAQRLAGQEQQTR